MHEGSDRSTFINTGLITTLCITKCDPSALCCFQPDELVLIKRGNQPLVGGIELSISLGVILHGTYIHCRLRHRFFAIVAGLYRTDCQQQKGIKVFQKWLLEIRGYLS